MYMYEIVRVNFKFLQMVFQAGEIKIKVSWNLPQCRLVLSLRAVLTAQETLSTDPEEMGSRASVS